MPYDDLGTLVPLSHPPQRVVSLVPSLTEAIAAEHRDVLVGATQWCTHPGDLAVPRFRGTKNPDVKALIAAAPELIVANREENRELDVRRLRAAGLPVWVTRIENLEQAFASLKRLFTVALGVPAPEWLSQAQQIWTRPGGTMLRVVTAIWRDPWMVVGQPTFTSDLLARLGAYNPFGGASSRYPHTTPAEILARRPDLVLLPDEPYRFGPSDGPEMFPDQLTALISGRLLTWYGPSLVTARGEIVAIMQQLRGRERTR